MMNTPKSEEETAEERDRRRQRIAGHCRRWMRQDALKYRQALTPRSFDGTLATYHQNLKNAMLSLQAAIHWRNQSRSLS